MAGSEMPGAPRSGNTDRPGRTSPYSTPGTLRSVLTGSRVTRTPSFPARSLQIRRIRKMWASPVGAVHVCWPTLSIQSGVTAGHPMWSEDRRDWVPAGELCVGERLLAANGRVRLETADRKEKVLLGGTRRPVLPRFRGIERAFRSTFFQADAIPQRTGHGAATIESSTMTPQSLPLVVWS